MKYLKNRCGYPVNCLKNNRCCEKTKYLIGPQGPMGATGPSGNTVVARNTTTIPSTQDASVTAFQDGDTTYLDFFIPKGADGVSEKIVAGTTTTLDPDQNASVQDRYEQSVHFLDFAIPKGEKGEKGETGPQGFPGEMGISEIITIDATETIEPNEPALVQDDKDRNVHHLTFFIPKGEKGDKGEKGASGEAGPPGLTPDFNATVFNSGEQSVTPNDFLYMPEIVLNNGFTFADGGLTVPATGTFLISFSVNRSAQAIAGDYVAVSVNGNVLNASKRPLTTDSNTSATLAVLLNQGEVVKLVAGVSQNTTISASGAPSSMLTIMMISY